MLTFLTAVAVAVYVVWLPGALFTRLVLPRADPFVRAVVGVALGFYGMPVVLFGAALVLRTIVSLELAFGVATAVNAACATWLRVRARRAAVRA
ncbi:MAG: hypothetical protein U0610_22385 [bacterium]